ncbi:LysR substrate-binding domain-containing protein [Parasphingopyxis marina]|uniref:LysR family transcriptional regulator n=1 Tax=Parasphingopyxis marina TaxID=2761622 RepID=A0A842I179_9SPHN|nr:LysR substrate-binding domain-containing protein [Parasphingopyxis marina]MBC2778453.1 LysR family transcriptional regulator [Parasphingopyxis marina]
MRRLPPLAAVRVFEAAARHENFTSAAEELGMSQAAVSYQVRALEEALGLPLFLRERGRVVLTETGSQLAGQVTAAFDTLDDAFGRIRDDDAATLRISAYTSFANRWLATRIGSFQLQHPDLAVRLDADNRLTDFARDDVDVAIRVGLGGAPGMHERFLMRVLYAPMASPAFIEEYGPFDTPERIAGSRLLNPDDRWWRRWFAEQGVTDPVIPPVGVRLDSQTAEGLAAIAGQGIAMLDPVFWEEELRDGRLIRLGDTIASRLSIWLVCPEHKRNLPRIKAFRDWIGDEVARHPIAGALLPPPA